MIENDIDAFKLWHNANAKDSKLIDVLPKEINGQFFIHTIVLNNQGFKEEILYTLSDIFIYELKRSVFGRVFDLPLDEFANSFKLLENNPIQITNTTDLKTCKLKSQIDVI